jgi:outer membrane lipoprotein-sorting protein
MWYAWVLLLALSPQEDNKAEKLFREMEGKMKKAKTLECVFEATFSPEGSVKGSLALAEGNRLRLEASGKVERQMEMMIISDGTKLVAVSNKERGEEREVPKSLNEMALAWFMRAGSMGLLDAPGGTKNSDVNTLLPVSSFKLGKEKKLDGRNAQTIAYELSIKGTKSVIAVVVWLDPKTNLPLKRVLAIDKGGGDKITITETYTRLTLDEKIDTKKFELPK